MSASNEWIEWHLTPSGWIKGSHQLDFCEAVNLDPPKDRVLTYRYSEYMGSSFSKLKTSVKEEWSSGDKETIQKLLKQFGDCPRGFYPEKN